MILVAIVIASDRRDPRIKLPSSKVTLLKINEGTVSLLTYKLRTCHDRHAVKRSVVVEILLSRRNSKCLIFSYFFGPSFCCNLERNGFKERH